MTRFSRGTVGELSDAVKGKTVESVRIVDGQYDFLVFRFSDGTELRVMYDWIEEWEVV